MWLTEWTHAVVENELSKRSYEESVWNDEYFSYLDIPPAIDLAFEHHLEEIAAWHPSGWTTEYAGTVEAAREAFGIAWPHDMRLSPAAHAAAKWLDFGIERL